ncbi:hypothetical protein F66182_4565 [Fusarium sp. NRRL 66182]|nr:hypothetical protein F66182_4565 [Fusarium sp. NRRL 66182]
MGRKKRSRGSSQDYNNKRPRNRESSSISSNPGISSPFPTADPPGTLQAIPEPSRVINFPPPFFQYPRDWMYDAEDPDGYREAFICHLADMEIKYTTLGVVNRPAITYGPDIGWRVHPQPTNDARTGDVYIYYESGQESKDFMRMPLRLMPLPTEKPRGRDPRGIRRIIDLSPFDNPAADTVIIFKLGIALSGLAIYVQPGQTPPVGAMPLERGELQDYSRLYWQPGELLGSDRQARAPISHSPNFLPPAEMDHDVLSATCRSHMAKYRRILGTGLGWGGYDRYHEWQRCGRQVRKSMVERKSWSKSNFPSVRFVSDETGAEFIVPTTCEKLGPQETTELSTLWEQLNERG